MPQTPLTLLHKHPIKLDLKLSLLAYAVTINRIPYDRTDRAISQPFIDCKTMLKRIRLGAVKLEPLIFINFDVAVFRTFVEGELHLRKKHSPLLLEFSRARNL